MFDRVRRVAGGILLALSISVVVTALIVGTLGFIHLATGWPA